MSDTPVMQVSHGFPGFDAEVTAAAVRALQDGRFSGGALKAAAEQRLAAFAGGCHARLTGSGFAALQAALMASGVRAGDAVILPTVTCPSVYHALRSLGAEPRVVDVGAELPLLDANVLPDDAARARFVIAPHMFGLALDLQPFHARGLRIIEDCAQYQRPGRDALAVASVYSFSPTKLQTMGYGGGVVSDDPQVDAALQRFLSPDDAEQAGDDLPFRVHAPVADFQCAMLDAQLDRYASTIARRQVWVDRYDELLDGPDRLRPELPFRYLLRLPPERDARQLAEALQQRGVSAWPLASQLLHRTFGLAGDYPQAERWQQRLLSLPLHEGLTEDMLAYVCAQLQALL